MTLALQIFVLLLVVVGLIATVMSIKNWHWAQMLLLLGIFFSSIGVLLLGLEVFRINRNIRRSIPALEQKFADKEAENEALLHGTRDDRVIANVAEGEAFEGQLPFDQEAEGGRMPGMNVWIQRLQDQARQRGRVWRGVKPSGQVDAKTGRIPVLVPTPRPHGLAQDTIVFAFEQGDPNPATPDQGAQFLGEFRVVEVRPDGVTLEAVQELDSRTGNRLVRSAQNATQNPAIAWRLYETMPTDSHELFANLTDEQLQQMLPAASVGEYVRHGEPATDDDDEYHRAGYDEEKRRLGPENADKAVEWRYDRPLRDYAYLFAELLHERVSLRAERSGLLEDNTKLKAAQVSAEKLTAHRTKEKQELGVDLEHMRRDQQVVEKLRDAVQQMLANAKQTAEELLQANAEAAQQLIQRDLARLREVDAAVPAPAVGAFTAPQ